MPGRARKRLPLALKSGKASNPESSMETLVNWYAEIEEPGSKSPSVLVPTPGSKIQVTLPTKPVYGMHTFNDELYAVTASKLYKIDQYGLETELGDVEIVDLVDMDDDGTWLTFVDGVKGYTYSVSDGVVEHTAPSFYPANSVGFMRGRMIFNRNGTGEYFISGTYKAREFDALEFATAENSPDDTLFLSVFKDRVWLFGKKTTEVHYYNSNVDFPFAPVPGVTMPKGLASPRSVAKTDNELIWLGDDLIFYKNVGYQPVRISTHREERKINGKFVADAFAFSYTDNGHIFYQVTFPTINLTMCYDTSTNKWHDKGHIVHGRHHANCHAYAYEKHFIGDFQNGNIYVWSEEFNTDDVDIIRRVMIPPPIYDNGHVIFISQLELEFHLSDVQLEGESAQPVLTYRFTDDAGESWSNESDRKLKNSETGKLLKNLILNRQGKSKNRSYEFIFTEDARLVITALYMRAAYGS